MFIQMVEMVVADEQIVNPCKDIRISGKFTLTLYKRDTSEYRIEHDSFTCQLEKEGIMSQPYQGIPYHSVQGAKIANSRIPLHRLLFFALRIGRETPFQHTSHPRTEAVLSIKKTSANHWISPPIWINGDQTFVSPKTYTLTHFYFLNTSLQI